MRRAEYFLFLLDFLSVFISFLTVDELLSLSLFIKLSVVLLVNDMFVNPRPNPNLAAISIFYDKVLLSQLGTLFV
jgi:hypothetical protein